jgi:TonB family protein
MNPSLWLRDIVSLTLQLTLIVCAGAALFAVLRIRDARASLWYWRGLFALCLLLPLCQPARSTAPPLAPMSMAGSAQAAGVSVAERESLSNVVARRIASPQAVLWVLAGGGIARGLWLVLGAGRLRRLRRDASPLEPLPASIQEAQHQLGVAARILVSDRVAGPSTFGFFDPVIILPPWIRDADPHVQEAIAYHELIHVRRGDWLDEIGEEIVRSLFWFHPAMRWLIGRVQLSREHVVDRCAIQLTASRDRYVRALLAVALSRSPVALVPAPLFLRRHLLKKRVAQILEETTMTTRRLIASFTVGSAVLALAAIGAVRSFPLQAQTPSPSSAPIEIVKGGEHLLHAAMAEYPRRAAEERVEGDVTLELTINDHGEVSDARVLSGPEELRKAALESALQWHFAPSDVRSINTFATLRFRVPDRQLEFEGRRYWTALNDRVKERSEGRDQDKSELSPVQRGERLMMELEKALADQNLTAEQRAEYEHKRAEVREQLSRAVAERRGTIERAAVEGPSRLVQIKTERLAPGIAAQIVSQAGVSIGDPITEEVAKRIREAARAVDEHLRVSFGGDGKGGTVLAIIAP